MLPVLYDPESALPGARVFVIHLYIIHLYIIHLYIIHLFTIRLFVIHPLVFQVLKILRLQIKVAILYNCVKCQNIQKIIDEINN